MSPSTLKHLVVASSFPMIYDLNVAATSLVRRIPDDHTLRNCKRRLAFVFSWSPYRCLIFTLPPIFPFHLVLPQVFASFSLKPFGLANTLTNLWQASLSPVAGAALTSAFKSVFGTTFGILDMSDIVDNWESSEHFAERASFINALQSEISWIL